MVDSTLLPYSLLSVAKSYELSSLCSLRLALCYLLLIARCSLLIAIFTAFALCALLSLLSFALSGLCPGPRFFSCVPRKTNQKEGTPRTFLNGLFGRPRYISGTRPAGKNTSIWIRPFGQPELLHPRTRSPA